MLSRVANIRLDPIDHAIITVLVLSTDLTFGEVNLIRDLGFLAQYISTRPFRSYGSFLMEYSILHEIGLFLGNER